MRKPLSALLAAALLSPPAAAQESPLVDMLNQRNYSRDSLLQHFTPASVTVSPPAAAPATAPSADSPADPPPPPAPAFRPIAPPPTTGQHGQPIAAIALILPLNSAGPSAAVASMFQQGCVDGMEALALPLQIDTYAHDGSAQQMLAAYREAVQDGAQVVIGPLQKNNVRALQQAHPQPPVDTLLLQPAAAPDGDGAYYVLTLDIEKEIAELARAIAVRQQQAIIVSDGSAVSQRQKSAFLRAWAGTGHPPPENFYIYDAGKDWQRLFENLKDRSEADEESDEPPAPPAALFAAGSGDFIRRARNFAPQRYPLYASSLFFSGSTAERFLDNLYIMEIPLFIGGRHLPPGSRVSPLVRTRPGLQQRFYALGADACRAMQQAPQWFNGWRMPGLSGEIELTGRHLRRHGILSRYQAGSLRPLQP